MRNGSRARVALGTLPKKLARLGRGVNEYRRALEAACEARHGLVTTDHAHAITLAAEAFQWGSVARWTMRQSGTSASDMLKASEAIVKAGEARNRAVARLDLSDPPPSADGLDDIRKFYERQRQRPPVAAPAADLAADLANEREARNRQAVELAKNRALITELERQIADAQPTTPPPEV